MFKSVLKILLIVIALFGAANAQYAVRVYSKHEGMHDQNISRPRIFVENIGTETIRDFYYYYYFTVENEKIPQVDRYSVPSCQLSLDNLGNGNYRVKYAYTNVDFKPGDLLPHAQGNVLGLRYIDWSTWDKANDYSFDNSSEFRQNGKIPVFLADGTQIYGSVFADTATTPQTPPQHPESNGYSNSSYAVFSSEYTDIRDRSTVTGGFAGSLVYTEVGSDASVNGDVLSGGNIFLRERAKVNGDAVAKQSITKQNNTVVTGTEKSSSEITFPIITPLQVNAGTRDAYVAPNGSGTINPGSYREIVIYANASVTFKTGLYNIDRLIIEPDVKLTFESQRGKKTDVRIKSECRFGDRVKFQFAGDTIPLAVSIYSEQTSQLRIGTDAIIYGQFTAPNASVVVNSRTIVYGMIMGKQVTIEPQSIVCKPATLSDFWHSEWAYGSTFDPLMFEYNAVVPSDVGTLDFVPYATQGTQVRVNGTRYENGSTINLSATTTSIAVETKQNCGKTVYVINVQRSPNYQIYVNEKSPASSGSEDGKSWRTAYKSLQRAIDAAGIEGKEIWVAEGTYYPTYKTNPNDPRTATFLIKPGIEIIGGFKGDETVREPQGSPYNTILNGDLSKNDGAAWPTPKDKLTDNAYHVVTMLGNGSVGKIRIENITITGGAADGAGEHSTGGGILNKNCAPALVFVAVERNNSQSSGAGIMDLGGIGEITNCLFRNNVSQAGGGGIYIANANGNTKINASVLTENSASNGGAIFIKDSNAELINCVLTQNTTSNTGGAIFSQNSELKIINNTFFENRSNSANSIYNENSTISIINSIFWNSQDGNANTNEIGGVKSNVSFSCVKGGYDGEENFDASPEFINPGKPAGDDGKWGTLDDGLNISIISSCVGTGSYSGFPETDILTFERNGARSDVGAYAYKSTTGDFLGILKKGQFIATEIFPVIREVNDERTLNNCILVGYARVIQIEVPKNKYTDKKNTIKANITGTNSEGSLIGDPTTIILYRVGSTQLFRSYYVDVENERLFGKSLVFTDINGIKGEYTHAYAIHGVVGGQVNISVPYNQFQ